MIDVLCSGGLDSCCHLAWAVHEFGPNRVRPRYYMLGQKYAEREIAAARRLCGHFGLELSVVEPFGNALLREDLVTGHIPFRNTFLFLASAMPVDCEGIVFGMLRGEASEDKNPAYLRVLREFFAGQFAPTIYSPGREFRIYTPFADKTKTQMLKWFIRTHYRTSLIEAVWDTVACYTDQRLPCGLCWSCYNRWVALRNCGMRDETYQENNHPAAYMLARLDSMYQHRAVDVPRFHTVSRLRSLAGILWLYENYTALSSYTKVVYGKSLLAYMRSWRRS